MVQENTVDLQLSPVEPQRADQDHTQHDGQDPQSQLQPGEEVGRVDDHVHTQGDQQQAASHDGEVVHAAREQLHEAHEQQANRQCAQEAEFDFIEGVEDALASFEASALEELLLNLLAAWNAVFAEGGFITNLSTVGGL